MSQFSCTTPQKAINIPVPQEPLPKIQQPHAAHCGQGYIHFCQVHKTYGLLDNHKILLCYLNKSMPTSSANYFIIAFDKLSYMHRQKDPRATWHLPEGAHSSNVAVPTRTNKPGRSIFHSTHSLLASSL